MCDLFMCLKLEKGKKKRLNELPVSVFQSYGLKVSGCLVTLEPWFSK